MARYKYLPGGLMLQWVTILMVLNIVVLLIAGVSTMMEIGLIGRLMEGQDVPEAEIAGNDLRQGAIGVLQIGIAIVLAILFLRSLSRANRNARALGAREMEFTPGWCIGWFFVPIANLFKPYQAVREMWRASTPSTGRWQDNPVSPLLGVWWTLWIISSFASQATFRLSLRAETADEILAASYVTLGSDLIDIPLNIVALMMLRGLFDLQQEKRRLNRRLRSEESLTGDILESSCAACGESLSGSETTCPMCGHQIEWTERADDGFGGE